MATGIIIELSYKKGYGFLREIRSGKILRFDLSDQNEGLVKNRMVEFNVLELDPGALAINLRMMLSEAQSNN